MTASPNLSSHHCIAVGGRALRQLRETLERDAGLQAATWLQDAGFAGGEALYNAYADWLRTTHGVSEPGSLDAARLSEVLASFFSEVGWGALEAQALGAAVLSLDSTAWAEAAEEGGATFPSCHFSCGLLADFLGRMSGDTVAVMEVECRTRGDDRCRFLAGAPDTMSMLYERMAQGMSYDEALGLTAVTGS